MVRRNKPQTICCIDVFVFSQPGKTSQKNSDEWSNVVANGRMSRCAITSQTTNNIRYTVVHDGESTKIEFRNCLRYSVTHIPLSFTVRFELSRLDVVLDR